MIITSSSPENHLDQLLPGVRVLHAIAGKREWLPLGHVHLVEKTRYNCEGQKEKNIHMADFTFGCLNQIEHHSVTNTCKLCINKSKMYIPPPCQPQPHRWSQSLETDLTWLCEWRPVGQGGRTRGGRSDNLSWKRWTLKMKKKTRETKWTQTRSEVVWTCIWC